VKVTIRNFGRPVKLKDCDCGSKKERRAEFDARGIFLTYLCDDCMVEKLSRYRPEVLYDPKYDTYDDVVDDEDDLI
jgi:hypothetical protein